MRTDIQQPGYVVSALVVRTSISGNQCSASNQYVDDYTDFSLGFMPMVVKHDMSSITYETEEETTWEGQKCKNYTDGSVSHFVKDGYLIGVEDPSDEMKIVIEYEFDDTRKEMVVSDKCKDDTIPRVAYSAPDEIKECKSEVVKIELAQLPCTFSLKQTSIFHAGQDTDVNEEEYKFYGNSSLYIYDEDDGETKMQLTRFDIRDEENPNSVLYVETLHSDGACTVYEWDFVEGDGSADREAFAQDLYCDVKKDSEFEGEKCTKCTAFDDGLFFNIYVKDGLVIGQSYGVEDAFSYKLLVDYTFKDFREDLVFNKSCICAGQPVPEKASSAPAEIKDCDSTPPTPPKRDASSTISVVASMIISMIMITLISLF